jgi:RNA polymerase sigma-70 factor, ECF subfamily
VDRPHEGEDSDVALMAAVAAGDREALAALYGRHASAVYGMAMTFVRDAALAQDISQEAFVRLWTRARAFDPARGTPLAWLLSVTRNLALDELRRQRRGLDRAERLAGAARLAAADQDVDALLHRGWESARVRAALSDLSALQRETVDLVYFQGYTLAEAAERLAVAVGTVKSRLHSALLGLRAGLADEVSVRSPGGAPR